MDWKTSTPEQKAKWLSQQMEDIRRSRALLDRRQFFIILYCYERSKLRGEIYSLDD